MPELPEVETIRREMEKELTGAKVKSVDVVFGGRLNVPAATFARELTGKHFASFGRRAKLLLVNFSGGWTVVTHLKMTGKYLLKKPTDTPGKHTHVIFHLADGRNLWFDDVRKFGYLKLVKTDELEEKVFKKEGYGPEPLEPGFGFEQFAACLKPRGRKKVKPLLMDQTCIAGIGNIYADEALWYGRVRPTRRVETLTREELRGIYAGILKTLRESLKHRGASADNYRDLYDEEGESVPYLRAYGKTTCSRCHGTMKRIYIGSRVAYFCPICQE